MNNSHYEQNDARGVASNRKRKLIQTIVSLLLWPSIVFGPCSLILVVITWNNPGVEGRWISYVGIVVFFIMVYLSVWLHRHKK